MSILIEEKKLAQIIKNAVKEAFQEEFDTKLMEVMLRFIPFVSDLEQKEIDKLYGKPGKDEVASSEIIEV
ncbi:hypothetical protein JXI42_07750 [bacterium]|nr:hypothetical protein [bacterium]